MATCRTSHASFYDPTYYHRPSDVLGCGNLRGDHDELGNCDECPVCKLGLCPSDEDVRAFDGLTWHKTCLLTRYRKEALVAVVELIEAAAELDKVDEEALYLDGDPREDLATQAYDAIHELGQWAKRNGKFIAEVTK